MTDEAGRWPLISSPRPHLDAERRRFARQPGLGLAGLMLVIPAAVLIAVGAGGAEPSLLVLGPLVTFALPVVVMIAFWWDDRPGSSLRPGWSGLLDTALIAAAAILLAMLDRGLLTGGEFGAFLVLVGVWQVWIYVVWRGWPCAELSPRWLRLVVANAVVAGAAWVTYTVTNGVPPDTVTALAGQFIAAALVVGVLFEGWLRTRLPPGGERIAALTAVVLLAAVLQVALTAYAHTLTWTRATAEDWVGHAGLNAIGVSVILHVAIGRRWPLNPATPEDSRATLPGE